MLFRSGASAHETTAMCTSSDKKEREVGSVFGSQGVGWKLEEESEGEQNLGAGVGHNWSEYRRFRRERACEACIDTARRGRQG